MNDFAAVSFDQPGERIQIGAQSFVGTSLIEPCQPTVTSYVGVEDGLESSFVLIGRHRNGNPESGWV
jgi:hypothetical protein